jgi:hypothetical protein
MKKRYVLVLTVLAAFVGGLVAHQPVADAASLLAVRIASPLDSQGDVRVSQQGTSNVQVTNPYAGPRNRILADQRITETSPGGATTPIDTRGASSVRIAVDFDSEVSRVPDKVCLKPLDAQGEELRGGLICNDGSATFVVHDVLAPRIKVVIIDSRAGRLDVRVIVFGLTD